MSVWLVAAITVAVSAGFVAEKSIAVESETESECDNDGDTAVAVVAVPVRRKVGGC